MSRKIKGISYDTDKDKDIINHLDQQQNFSKYIINLIRKDMRNNDLKSVIRAEIESYLSKVDLTTTKENDLKIDDINEIKRLIDM